MTSPSHPIRAAKATAAFTLVELLVVVAVIGILAALTLPAVKRMTDSSTQAKCANNLRQIGIMTRSYLTDNQNTFPQMWTWMTELADYSPETTVLFHCPSDLTDRPGVAKNRWRSYAINPVIHNFLDQCPAINRPNERSPYNTPINVNVVFRPSKMFYLTENYPVGGNVYSLDNPFGSISGNPGQEGKHHGKRTNLLMIDGHVESIEYKDWYEFANTHLFNNEA
jgi:prepilin-type N-terminal cleavage/methylation domain-containing protein/prepilin-type processing-associated H-X9-DG protein